MAKTNLYKLKVFPPAALFPLIPDDELKALAADIEENGQRDPVVTAMIDGEEMLVDGRNRLAACKIAGVEPESRQLNGEDPRAYVASVNLNRRHMTKSQRAMLAAMLYPEPAKVRRKGAGPLEIKGQLSVGLLSQARTVLATAPEVAKQVAAGNMPLAEAYAAATQLKQQGWNVGNRLDRLREAAPDLAELVDTGTLTVENASSTHERREVEKQEAEANQREVSLRICESTYRGIISFGNKEFVDRLVKYMADRSFRAAFAARVRPLKDDPTDFTDGAKALAKVMKLLKKGD